MNEILPAGLPWMALVWATVAGMIAGSAVVVITRRNPVSAIAWLVVHFVSTAGLYLVLNSQFVAAIQVLVYAGAIIVLFLFVVMLLSADREPDQGLTGGTGRLVFVSAAMTVLVAVFARVAAKGSVPGSGIEAPVDENTVAYLARWLFTEHLVAFEISSIPILAAMSSAELGTAMGSAFGC